MKEKAAKQVPKELIHAVRSHALTHYEEGGWDVLVECWSDEDIAKLIGGATTITGAIRNCARPLKAIKDYGDDIRATAF